jgi:hypothetical protein
LGIPAKAARGTLKAFLPAPARLLVPNNPKGEVMNTTRKCLGLVTVALLSSGSSLFGVPVFSVANGGIIITSQSTAGPASTQATAWTVNETMTSPGTLSLSDTDGTPLGTLPGFTNGSWITKTVVNNSGVVWTSFEMELQQILGTASGEGDGLSFAQGGGLVFSSNQFATITRIDTTRDYLNFSNGDVQPGESVIFNFAVSDNSATTPIFLLQTPNRVDTPNVPDSGSAGLLFLIGLMGLLGLRRKLR